MSEIKKIKILNLVGGLEVTMTAFFQNEAFQIVERGVLDNFETLNYILVSSFEEAIDANKDFACDKHDIQIICIGEVTQMRDFLLANGRLVIARDICNEDLGIEILKKFFFGEHSIHLAESFNQVIPETTEFAISNHLSIGTNIDKLCFNAFENGFDIVTLRTFMDHAIHYLAYLRQAGVAGLPYEIEYGHNGNFFVVNIQTSVKNFVAEYLLESFGDINSNDPLKFLLGVMQRSCTFLDITAIENPSKVVFNGVWSKNEEFSFSGLGFHNILTTKQIVAKIERQMKEYTPEQEQAEALNAKAQKLQSKKLPGGIAEINTQLEINSVLNEEPGQIETIVNFTVEKFELNFPDQSLPNLTMESFDTILEKHPDQEFIEQLSENDKEHLLERLQKKEMLDTFDFDTDEEVTPDALENVDLGVLENLMGDMALPEGDPNQQRGEFDVNDPFANPNQVGADQLNQNNANMVDPSQLDQFGQLPQMPAGMPEMDIGDPFATGEFNPDMPGDGSMPAAADFAQENIGAPDPSTASMIDGINFDPNQADPFAVGFGEQAPAPEEKKDVPPLPADVQKMINPVTGEEMLLKLDSETSQMIPVEYNEETKEFEPVATPQALNPPTGNDAFAMSDTAAPLPGTGELDPTQAPTLISTDELGALNGLPTIDASGMPDSGMGDDPFATGDFDQAAHIPKEELPEGVQEIMNPATGKPMHVMIDEKSGMPIPVQIDPETKEVKPIDTTAAEAQAKQKEIPVGETFSLGEKMPELPGGQTVPQPLVDTNSLDPMAGLGAMGELPQMQGGMPEMDIGDPFATEEEFDPSLQKQEQPLPPGVQAMVNPQTGEAVHIMMDPKTGVPVPVEVDMTTGEVKPIHQANPEFAKEDEISEAQKIEQAPAVNPKTGQPVMEMVDPKTGEKIHISMDPETGQPVQIDPVSGEPIQVNVNQTVNHAAGGGVQNITISQMGDMPDFGEPGDDIVPGGDFEDDFSQTVTGNFDELDEDTVVGGLFDEDEPSLVFGGDEDDPEDMTIVPGGKEEADNFMQQFSSMNEVQDNNTFTMLGDKVMDTDKNAKFVVSGSEKENEKQFKQIIKNNLKDDESMNPAMKAFISENAPEELQKGLMNFAKAQGKNPEDLDQKEIGLFKAKQVPQIMQKVMGDTEKAKEFSQKIEDAKNQDPTVLEQNKQVIKQYNEVQKEGALHQQQQTIAAKELEEKFKNKFQQKMQEMQKKMNQLQKEAGSAKAEANKLKAKKPSEKEIKKVLHETMKESFKEQIDPNASAEDKAKKEQEIVKGMSKTLNIPEEQVKEIVAAQKKPEKEEKTVVSEGGGAANAALMTKLKKMEEENKKLKEGMNALRLKKDVTEKTDKKVAEVKDKVVVKEEDVDKTQIKEENKLVVPEPEKKVAEDEKQSILDKLNKGEELTEDEKQKMAVIFDTGANATKEMKKAAERNIKKLQLEAEQKEILFKSEIEKAEKSVKAKELVLDKAKETMKTVVTKKEQEIVQLKSQVSNLSQKLQDDRATALSAELKAVKKEKEDATKMSDVYKKKIETMAKKLDELKREDNTAHISEENRNLKLVKANLEKKMAETTKAMEKMEQVTQGSADKENKLKSDLSRARGELKKQEGTIKGLKDQQKSMVKKVQELTTGKASAAEREIEQHKSQNAKLQTKIREMQLKLKNTNTEVKAVDEKQIEKAITQKFETKVKSAAKEVEMQKNQNKQLQAKIKELSDKLSGGGNSPGKDGKSSSGSPNEKRLEANVKKLNAELSKSKNESANHKKEIMKAKKEATGLKNQLTAMKKELEKAKKLAAAAKGKKAA